MSRTNIPIKILLITITVVLVIISLGPVIWLYISSFKSTGELFVNRWGLPNRVAWENYTNAWVRGNIGGYFFNSVVISAISIAVMTLLGAMTGFAISKYSHVKAGFYVLLYFLLGQMVPAQIVIIPLYLFLNKMGLLNSYSGLILVYIASGLPFVVLILQGFFRSIPKDLYEAATIDGYSELSVFTKIALPLAMPAIATTLIIQFKYVWNEFALALVLNSDKLKMTLPVGIYRAAVEQFNTDYGLAFAGICITLVPMVVFYVLFQKHILGGITAGALKG